MSKQASLWRFRKPWRPGRPSGSWFHGFWGNGARPGYSRQAPPESFQISNFETSLPVLALLSQGHGPLKFYPALGENCWMWEERNFSKEKLCLSAVNGFPRTLQDSRHEKSQHLRWLSHLFWIFLDGFGKRNGGAASTEQFSIVGFLSHSRRLYFFSLPSKLPSIFSVGASNRWFSWSISRVYFSDFTFGIMFLLGPAGPSGQNNIKILWYLTF